MTAKGPQTIFSHVLPRLCTPAVYRAHSASTSHRSLHRPADGRSGAPRPPDRQAPSFSQARSLFLSIARSQSTSREMLRPWRIFESSLVQAMAGDNPGCFTGYVRWSRVTSAGTPSRMGVNVVPIPRLTYRQERPILNNPSG
jgi:hypothetical protein